MERNGLSVKGSAIAMMFLFAAVAGIGFWAADFTSDTAKDATENSDQIVSCSRVGMEVVRTAFDAGNQEIDLTIRNTGTEKMTNVSVAITYADGTEGRYWVEGPPGARVGTVSVPAVNASTAGDVSDVTIYPVPCQQQKVSTTPS